MDLCIKHHRKRITEKKLCVLQKPNSTKNLNSTCKDKKCAFDVNDYLILYRVSLKLKMSRLL